MAEMLMKKDVLTAMRSKPKGIPFTEYELDQVPVFNAFPMVVVNETYSKDRLRDRKQFVTNLGFLLKQTREQIIDCYLDDDDLVHITYVGGYEKTINVRMDSYLAIIRDVTKYL